MYRLAAAMILSSAAIAQTTQEAEIALAAKSPIALARYVESHRDIDWKALRNALGLKESEHWLAPCGSDFPAGEAPCSAETVVVSKPDQAILIIRGGQLSYTVEYLRYLQDSKGGWQFAGENNAFQRNSPSHYKLMQFGDKPFLTISSDHSQIGFATRQVLEDWFDLTQQDFDPVLSITVDGGQSRFGLGVGRTMHAAYALSQTAGLERVELTLNVHFDGVGLDQEATYFGVYERPTNAKTFTLGSAYSGAERRTMISTRDFEELADPFSRLSNEELLTYALPGLRKIATGSDPDAKKWLQSVLSFAEDTPEKRALLELLTKR
jgi:hypothetical protein